MADILASLSSIASEIGAFFANLFESVSTVFYNPTAEKITFVGILVLIAVVIGVAQWVLRMVLRLFKLKG